MISIAGSLKNWRVKRGLSQDDLAEISGITKNTISEIERGIRQNVQLDTCKVLADSLGIKVYELLDEALPRPTIETALDTVRDEVSALREHIFALESARQLSAEERELLQALRSESNEAVRMFLLWFVTKNQKYRDRLAKISSVSQEDLLKIQKLLSEIRV